MICDACWMTASVLDSEAPSGNWTTTIA